MTDSKYFTTTKKGEIFELKSELNSDKKEKKREAVKKVRIFSFVSKASYIKFYHFPYKLNYNELSDNCYLGNCLHDRWKRRQCTVSRCCKLYAGKNFGILTRYVENTIRSPISMFDTKIFLIIHF